MAISMIYRGLVGQSVFDKKGQLIGKIHALYYDVITSRPEWMAIENDGDYKLMPLSGTARYRIDSDVAIWSTYPAEMVHDGPRVDPPAIPPQDGGIDDDTVERLFAYYGFDINSPRYGPERRIDTNFEVMPSGNTEANLLANGARLRTYLTVDLTQLNADP
jgi:hypothetical protein